MPVIDIHRKYLYPLEKVFDVLFGPDLFYQIHREDGHMDLRCSAWSGQHREVCYVLPEKGALKAFRQGDTTVTVTEVATWSDAGVEVVSTANNKGGAFAEMTKVSVTFTLKRVTGGTSASAKIVYSFAGSLLVRRVVESAMAPEMRDGYQKLLEKAEKMLAQLPPDQPPEPESAPDSGDTPRTSEQISVPPQGGSIAVPPAVGSVIVQGVIGGSIVVPGGTSLVVPPSEKGAVLTVSPPPPATAKAVPGSLHPLPSGVSLPSGVTPLAGSRMHSALGPPNGFGVSGPDQETSLAFVAFSSAQEGTPRIQQDDRQVSFAPLCQNLTFRSAKEFAGSVVSEADNRSDTSDRETDIDPDEEVAMAVGGTVKPPRNSVEARRGIRIAASVGLASLGGLLPQIVELSMLGRLDRDGSSGAEHAGAAAAALLWMHVTAALPLRCVPLAQRGLCSAARGMNDPARCREWAQLSVLTCCLLCLVAGALWVVTSDVVGWALDLESDVQDLVKKYAHYSLIGLLPQGLCASLTAYDQATSAVWTPALMAIVAALVQVVLGYFLVWGVGGWDGLGFIGSPVAAASARWLQLLVHAVVARCRRRHRVRYHSWEGRAFSYRRISSLAAVLLPVCTAVALEEIPVHALTVAAAHSGPRASSLAAHWSLTCLVGVAGAIMAGVHAALRTRTGYLLTVGVADKAAFSTKLWGGVLVVLGLVAAGVFLVSGKHALKAFTSDEAVIETAGNKAVSAAAVGVGALGLAHAGTAVQLARARVRALTASILVGSWLVALPVSVSVGVKGDKGIEGVWIGQGLGLVVAAVITVIAWYRQPSFSEDAQRNLRPEKSMPALQAHLTGGTHMVSFVGNLAAKRPKPLQGVSNDTFTAPTVLYPLDALGGQDAAAAKLADEEEASWMVVAARPGGATSATLGSPAALAAGAGVGPAACLLYPATVALSHVVGNFSRVCCSVSAEPASPTASDCAEKEVPLLRHATQEAVPVAQ